ncbi:hypothetical protein Hanom_Chr14g01313351 [Helianthus anomalus]
MVENTMSSLLNWAAYAHRVVFESIRCQKVYFWMHLENSVTDFISSALAQQVNGAGLLHTTYGTPKHVALEGQTIVSFFLFLHYGFRLFALLWIYNFFVFTSGRTKNIRGYIWGKVSLLWIYIFFRGVYNITQRVCKHNWFFTLERSQFVLYYHSPFHLSSDTCKRPSKSSFYCV